MLENLLFEQEQEQSDDTELQPIKILYLFNTLNELNEHLVKSNMDNTELQFFLNNMSGLSYNTILVVITNLIEKYQGNIKNVKEDVL